MCVRLDAVLGFLVEFVLWSDSSHGRDETESAEIIICYKLEQNSQIGRNAAILTLDCF